MKTEKRATIAPDAREPRNGVMGRARRLIQKIAGHKGTSGGVVAVVGHELRDSRIDRGKIANRGRSPLMPSYAQLPERGDVRRPQ